MTPGFCKKARNSFLAYANTAQGSRKGPLSGCTIAALLATLTQGLLNIKKEARIQCYVNDPSVAVCGNKRERQRICHHNHCVKSGRLQTRLPQRDDRPEDHVGQREHLHHRLGNHSEHPGRQDRKVAELDKAEARCNIVSVKSLRTYKRKVTSLASLVDVLRPPFATELYAALKSPEHPELREKTKARENYIWEKQIDIALHWIQAFLAKQKGALEKSSL